MNITTGSLWHINGTTYRVDTLDNGRAQYPITLVPVAHDAVALQRIEGLVDQERQYVGGVTEEQLSALRERLLTSGFDTELRWFERADVKQVAEGAQRSLFDFDISDRETTK